MLHAAPGTLPALAAFLVVLACQRAAELALSARNARRLLARGAHEVRADGFPWLVAIHTAFPVALAAEVLAGGAAPGAAWPAWLALWLGAQALRLAAMRALGARWNVRVIVLPGAPPVRSGPYRLLRHPNYAAVVIEFIAAPLLFGAWRTMILFSIVNALALVRRIRIEERALETATRPHARAAAGVSGTGQDRRVPDARP